MDPLISKRILIALSLLAGAYLLFLGSMNAFKQWQISGGSSLQSAKVTDCSVSERSISFPGVPAFAPEYAGRIHYISNSGHAGVIYWQGAEPPPRTLCIQDAEISLSVYMRNPTLAYLPNHSSNTKNSGTLNMLIQLVFGILIVRAAGLSLTRPAV